MALHFFFMGRAKADQSMTTLPDCENEAMAPATNAAESPIPDFPVIEAGILDYTGLGIEPGEIGKRNAVLGQVRGIFRRIEFDFHQLIVVTDNCKAKEDWIGFGSIRFTDSSASSISA